MRALATALVVSAMACAAPGISSVRYANKPVVTRVNDRRNVPTKPRATTYMQALYHFDGFFHRRLTRFMEMRPTQRARNVNSFDEVPDSTWFTNRVGVESMTIEQALEASNRTGSPEAHKPWKIKSAKEAGVAIGFVIEDARGYRYLLKFDWKGIPEMQTGNDVIVQRLLWLCGYNTPEDYVVQFARDDLLIADGATYKDGFGNKRPLTVDRVNRQLARVDAAPDGTIRALVSLYIPGIPVGGHPRDGVRPDDPNDVVRHELRRDLRGQYTFFAWLDHTDVKEDNTLDMWTEDPKDPARRYLVHYLVDFNKSLGAQSYLGRQRHIGHAYLYDFRDMFWSAVSAGLARRSWENRARPPLTGIGLYDSTAFHPDRWKPYSPSYFPFHDRDRFDSFWAAKILIRIRPDVIRAVVEQGRYSDPRATEYLARTIVERQRKTARYWFNRVNPVDGFTLEPKGDSYKLCFDDLAVKHRLVDRTHRTTTYRAEGYDFHGSPTGWRGAVKSQSGRVCMDGVKPSSSENRYTIIRLHTLRGALSNAPVLVHLAGDPKSEGLRIIGIRRE